MSLAQVTQLLGRRIGLDPASLGPNALANLVAERARALGVDREHYAGTLATRPEEFNLLVEKLVVPETWFFRGAGLFEELARIVAEERGQKPTATGDRPFRALSVPCASGEEPYSLAMALLDAGLGAERWTIDGIDLSPRLIAAAHRAVYREFSFRQTDPERRRRYFRDVPGGAELDAHVRRCVRFQVGNLVDPAFLAGESGSFDLILCRNLLIYLTPEARRQALATLERLLVPGGLLAVGHAEPQVLAGRPFRAVGPTSCFLFRHDTAIVPTPRPPLLLLPPPRPRSEPAPRPTAVPVRVPIPAPAPVPVVAAVPASSLERVRALADSGRLDEALSACRAYLKDAGPGADAFSLLGVILQARGDTDEAGDAFRKALYLAPQHREALTHAMLLAAERGDTTRARILRVRLESGGEP